MDPTQPAPEVADVYDLSSALLAYPQTARVKVYRKENREDVYRATMDAHAELLDDVRETYGGGAYMFRLLDAEYRQLKQVRESIGGKPKFPDEAEPEAQKPEAAPLAQVVAQAVAAALAPFARTVAQLAERTQAPPPPDPFAMMEKMATTMAALRPAAGGEGALSIADTLALIEFGERRGGDSKGDGFGDLAPIVSNLTDIAKGEQDMRKQLLALRARRQQLPADPKAAAFAQIVKAVAPFKNYVVAWARAGESVEDKAAVVLGMAPEALLGALEELAEVEELSVQLARALQLPEDAAPWAVRLFAEVQAQVAGDGEAEGDEDAA